MNHGMETTLQAMGDEDLKWIASRANAMLAQRRQDAESRARDGMHDRAKPPKAGEPGSSLATAIASKIWPGLYFSRCRYCTAYMIAEKRTPHCDPCEEARRWSEASPNRPVEMEDRSDGEG